MTTTERSTVLGVFADHDRANQAIDELRRAGFNYSQVRIVEHGGGGFLDTLKSLFTGQEITGANTPDDLMKLGVPEQDARYYQGQLDAGHAIVMINASGHMELALGILRQSGAYDISARLRTAEMGVPPSTAESAPARSGTYNPNVPPGTYNPNAPQGTYNPDVPPGPPR